MELLRRSVELEPESAEFHSNLAAVLGSLGRLEESAAALERAIALAPDHAQAHANLAVTLEKLGRLDPAAQVGRVGDTQFTTSAPNARR